MEGVESENWVPLACSRSWVPQDQAVTHEPLGRTVNQPAIFRMGLRGVWKREELAWIVDYVVQRRWRPTTLFRGIRNLYFLAVFARHVEDSYPGSSVKTEVKGGLIPVV